jgi:hypothetical protein
MISQSAFVRVGDTERHMIQYNPSNCLHRLIYKRFDYAGMFPPAALSFDEMLAEAAGHATTLTLPWMIGTSLVLDAGSAKKLATHNLIALPFTSPLTVSVLVTDGVSSAIEAAKALDQARGTLRFRVTSFEAKVSPATLPVVIKELGGYTERTGASIALEPDLSISDWREVLQETVQAISKSPLARQLALKCRCTGPTGIDAEKLAVALAVAADARLGFKVTGGFHHPITEPAVHTYPMGFLNLSCAVYLRRAMGAAISQSALAELLTNNSITRFSFSEGVACDAGTISAQQLETALRSAPFSIGSCSIHEPDEDLVRLLGLEP